MKRFIIGVIAGASLAATATGVAATQWMHTTNGILCQSNAGGVICMPTRGNGYGVGIHKDFVFVENLATERVVFKRFQ